MNKNSEIISFRASGETLETLKKALEIHNKAMNDFYSKENIKYTPKSLGEFVSGIALYEAERMVKKNL
jgi:hypothetical protein